jgi:hypothetical protein
MMKGVERGFENAELTAGAAASDARPINDADGTAVDKSQAVVIVGGCGTFGTETHFLRLGEKRNYSDVGNPVSRTLDCMVAGQSRLHERPVPRPMARSFTVVGWLRP